MKLQIVPDELAVRIEKDIGPFQVVKDHRAGSARTGVWEIASLGDGRHYYVKSFSRKHRWHTEVYAYTHWMTVLKPYVPELLEVYEGEDWQGILITAIEGTIMRSADLAPAARYAAYRTAGEWIRTLHESMTGQWFGQPDSGGNPIEGFRQSDPVAYVRHSLQELMDNCMRERLLQPAEQQLADWALEHVEAFAGARPVPVSWDATPGNWLVDGKGELAGMIDFENMLWGIDADQFSILFERYFIEDQAAAEAFFEGYGPDFPQAYRERIRICCIKLALGDIYWGTKHNVTSFTAYGRRLLAHLMEEDAQESVPT